MPPITNPNTYVYVDGFNLYHRALKHKGRGIKWLDLNALCKNYLTNHNVTKIKYFTAYVSGRYDQNEPIRQQIYLRALATLPNVEVILGKFQINESRIRITQDVTILWEYPEEKRTDVNLGVHLMNDAHLKRFDTAIMLSNDSDVAEALRIAKEEMGLCVGLMNPDTDFNKELLKYADKNELYKIRRGALQASQFPRTTMSDANGTFTKPAAW